MKKHLGGQTQTQLSSGHLEGENPELGGRGEAEGRRNLPQLDPYGGEKPQEVGRLSLGNHQGDRGQNQRLRQRLRTQCPLLELF